MSAWEGSKFQEEQERIAAENQRQGVVPRTLQGHVSIAETGPHFWYDSNSGIGTQKPDPRTEEHQLQQRMLQASLDSQNAYVTEMARKAGVPSDAMQQGMLAFARWLVPHTGRDAKPVSRSRMKAWWSGYAAGLHQERALRAQAERRDAVTLEPRQIAELREAANHARAGMFTVVGTMWNKASLAPALAWLRDPLGGNLSESEMLRVRVKVLDT
jgi:hypothetical protein